MDVYGPKVKRSFSNKAYEKRSHENCGNLSLNSVAFAGTLLVKNAEDLLFVKTKGHTEILKAVTYAQ